MYGIPPDRLSNEYALQEVIALSHAASRFLARTAVPVMKPAAVPERIIAGPDHAGFRELYGSHYKKTLGQPQG